MPEKAGVGLSSPAGGRPRITRHIACCGAAAASDWFHLGDLVACRLNVASMICGAVDLPATFDGAPDELEVRVGRQLFGAHCYFGASRPMFGGSIEAPHIAV